MPKCLECGFEASRLQWTHFKYKCTGRFSNGREYKKVYPSALLVDKELAKNTAITKNNLIKKYGVEDGNSRWNSYVAKQAASNTFEYKLKKHGMTREQFDEYNESRSCTLQNMITRHGEEKGIIYWEEYIERQRYTNSLSYFIQQYGELGELKWNQYCKDRGKSSNIEFVQEKYNLSKEQAELKLADRYKNRYTSKSEKQFVENLERILGKLVYTNETKQYCIWSHELSAPLFYDVTDYEKKKIIEYNGDYWHCNPNKYSSDFIIKQSGVSALEVWQRDAIKLNEAKKRGFSVLVIWESDYFNNRQAVENQILKWWNE